jgi:uncharacterized protein
LKVVYADTSALAKLFIHEAESGALRRWLSNRTELRLVSSWLLVTELVRLIELVNPEAGIEVDEFLEAVDLVDITTNLLERASEVKPRRLRTLDAIHLATALELRDSVSVFLSYNKRLLDAAGAAGLAVAAPE